MPRTANDQVNIFDLDPDDQPELDQDDLDNLDNLDDQEIEAAGDDDEEIRADADQDDAGDDDAGDDEDGGELDPQPDPRQTQSRAARRNQVLANENRTLRSKQTDLERRLDELTRTIAQPRQQQTQPRETQEQRAARRALMTSDERIEEDRREADERHTRDMGMLQFQLRESSDRNSFESKCAAHPVMRKWQAKVEAELANIRSQGQNVDREQLFYYMIGKAAFEASNSPESRKQRRQAARRVRAQTVRPGNSRSDEAPAAGRRETTSREKRLENIQL